MAATHEGHHFIRYRVPQKKKSCYYGNTSVGTAEHVIRDERCPQMSRFFQIMFTYYHIMGKKYLKCR